MTTKKPLRKAASSTKPRAVKTKQVMVTFGVRSEKLKKEFDRLWKKTDLSEAGFARELIKEGIELRLLKK
ncbi:hypothetical protein [Herminiimonas contaminans]|uniref:Ribbon-helix-helix protein CopG domain-containing protein n=1 Tax=Herminiimonas contaminans TaxID=1111140 RepID=A0ABS0EUS5_9BURK|nr:hypothetical protein [Herminiimonas contaminans]MBF8176938.1 hypothetical protein [Herminiimonas contaminans]